jgi:esterase/lipase
MRRAALAIVLLLVAMFAFGPRAHFDPDAVPEPEVPDLDELDAFVRAREAAIDDLTPGTAARIVWAGEDRARRPWSVVGLHGFSATRQETAPLAARVAEGLGAHLFEARFTGHGRNGAALAEASAEDWLLDAKTALAIGDRLGERTLVLASSTGATFAYLAAATGSAPGVAGMAFLSPNFGPANASSQLLLFPWAKAWVPLVVGEERSWEPTNEAHGRYWTTRYPIEALFPMMASVAAARDADPDRVALPLRVFVHPGDDVVSPRSTREVLSAVTAPVEITEVEGPGDTHVLAGDILSPARTGTIAQDILTWARDLPD